MAVTGGGIYYLGGLNSALIQTWLNNSGIWAPIIYILLYTIATLLILPSTPLNLSGGAIFGVVWGTVWTTIAAIVAAIVAFWFTRTIGRETIRRRFAGKWEKLDAELHHGGLFYMFAIRLLPLIPYGLVNFTAGLTVISWRNYIIGTMLGTVPGILPFVMMGAGLTALQKGDLVPIMGSMGLIGLLVGTTTWYRRRF